MHTLSISGKNFEVPVIYQAKSVIGSGAYGQVACATNVATKQNVAIKKMTSIFGHPVLCKRAIREVKLLKQLKHPNIIEIMDLSMDKVCFFLLHFFLITHQLCCHYFDVILTN